MCACVSGGGVYIREQKVTLSSNFALKRGGGGGCNNEGGITKREYGIYLTIVLSWEGFMQK